MYMIFVMVRLFDVEFRVMGGDFEQFPVDMPPYFGGDDGATVFCRKDYVVITQVDAVT